MRGKTRRVLKGLLAGLVGLVVLLLVWGVFIEPRLILDVERQEAPLARLPAAWEGQQVAVISDVQLGMWLDNDGMVRRAVERIIQARPAAALIAGDFVYVASGNEPYDEVQEVVRLLRPLAEAGIPTFAVLGNHDYWQGRPKSPTDLQLAEHIEQQLEQVGIQVLRNEAVALPGPRGGEPLYIVGIDSEWAQRDKPREALREVPEGAARFTFMHNPDSFEEIPEGAAPVAVAGHTHGGQIRIPGLPEWTWLNLAWSGPVYADGWIDGLGAEGNRLYVNRGIGFSRAPVRINCPPELTLFTLRQGPGGAVPAQAGGEAARADAPLPPGAELKQVTGTLEDIDRSQNTVEVSNPAQGEKLSFVLEPDVEVRVDGKPASPRELSEGAQVRAAWREAHGQKELVRLEVLDGMR